MGPKARRGRGEALKMWPEILLRAPMRRSSSSKYSEHSCVLLPSLSALATHFRPHLESVFTRRREAFAHPAVRARGTRWPEPTRRMRGPTGGPATKAPEAAAAR